MRIKVNPDLLDTNAKQIQTMCTELTALAGKLSTTMRSMDIEAQKIAPVRTLVDQTVKMATDGAVRGNELAKIMTTKAALFRQIDSDGAKAIAVATGTFLGISGLPSASGPKPLPSVSQIALNQWDARWASTKMNNASGETLRSYGCLMTSLSMLCKANGVNMDPAKVDKWNDTHNGYAKGSSVMPIEKQSEFLRETLGRKGSIQKITDIKKELGSSRPVILELPGHFVVAVGTDSHGNYICADPNGGKQRIVKPSEIRSARVFK